MTEAIHSEGAHVSRRDFVKSLGATALASSVPLTDPTRAPAETAVARLYKSFGDDQKARICFPFDHPLRSQVHNNWSIVEPSIGDLNPGQKALCAEIFRGLCSDLGHELFLRQMGEDYGGFENYHVAVFGEPGTDKPFEWVITGRHATLRADGNRFAGASFGGPIFYGHASHGLHEGVKHSGNVWWYQAERANEIFQSLDHEQKARALVSRAEPAARHPAAPRGDVGLPVAGLNGSQKAMVRKLLKDLLSPFRDPDAGEFLSSFRDSARMDRLRLTYYQEGDVGNDGVWDVWKLEGPAFSWYYHGSPHVHAWLDTGGASPVG